MPNCGREHARRLCADAAAGLLAATSAPHAALPTTADPRLVRLQASRVLLPGHQWQPRCTHGAGCVGRLAFAEAACTITQPSDAPRGGQERAAFVLNVLLLLCLAGIKCLDVLLLTSKVAVRAFTETNGGELPVRVQGGCWRRARPSSNPVRQAGFELAFTYVRGARHRFPPLSLARSNHRRVCVTAASSNSATHTYVLVLPPLRPPPKLRRMANEGVVNLRDFFAVVEEETGSASDDGAATADLARQLLADRRKREIPPLRALEEALTDSEAPVATAIDAAAQNAAGGETKNDGQGIGGSLFNRSYIKRKATTTANATPHPPHKRPPHASARRAATQAPHVAPHHRSRHHN
jgi:hypothetical protein